MTRVISLVSGIIFGIGLVISEMINPEKVLGFLNLFGNWDPSLAFVMIGALAVSSPLFHLIKNNFGAGWGLGGLCPGPAISSIALINYYSITFVVSMFVGFYLVKLFESTTQAR